MCGRYTVQELRLVQAALGMKVSPAFEEFSERPDQRGYFNVTPSQSPPVIRRVDEQIIMDQELRWGYDHPTLPKLVFNSKTEKIEGKMWGSSFRQRRCLVPASGFFDWDRSGQPYYFRLKSRQPFCFPGIWQGDRFSFATVEPNEVVRPIHRRMPVILVWPEQWLEWLARPAKELLQQLPADLMEVYPIGKFGTRDSPQNIEPLSTPIPKQGNLFE